ELGELGDRLDVWRLQIDERDIRLLPRRLRPGVEFLLDRLDDRGLGGAAVVGLVLHTVPVVRIVAGSDDYAARRGTLLHGIGNGRRGNVIVRHRNVDPVARDDLGGGFGEAARAEARVIAHDHALLRILFIVDVSSDRGGDEADVLKGEVVS